MCVERETKMKMMIIGLACVSMMANAQWVYVNRVLVREVWSVRGVSTSGMYMAPNCGPKGRFINRDSTENKGISLSKGGNKGISLSKGGSKKLTLTTKRTTKRAGNRNRK